MTTIVFARNRVLVGVDSPMMWVRFAIPAGYTWREWFFYAFNDWFEAGFRFLGITFIFVKKQGE